MYVSFWYLSQKKEREREMSTIREDSIRFTSLLLSNNQSVQKKKKTHYKRQKFGSQFQNLTSQCSGVATARFQLLPGACANIWRTRPQRQPQPSQCQVNFNQLFQCQFICEQQSKANLGLCNSWIIKFSM